VWSPDGVRIAFISNRQKTNETADLYVKTVGSGASEEVLLENRNAKCAVDWSKDGRYLLYYEVSEKGEPTADRDLWALRLTGSDRKVIRVSNSPFDEIGGQYSPDGQFVAYETNESGRFEIVVQRFPEATGKLQISTNGGRQPRWRRDGKELYFVAP